jgi:hypothetical protein
MPAHRSAAAILIALSVILQTTGLRAQCIECDGEEPRWRGDAVSVVVNSLLGGVTAGVERRLRGGSFGRAFVAGAAGGALTYAGKRIAVERFGGAGLLGREVAAVGSSVSRNAAEGRAPLERVMLPLGPIRLYLSPLDDSPVQARLDAAAVVATAYFATRPGARFDAGESLSAGALVFRAPGSADELGFEGVQAAGAILLRHFAGEAPSGPGRAVHPERIAAHERVHVIQYDQTFLLWAAPAEAWAMDRARWSRGVHRWVDLGTNAALMAGLDAALPYEARPWEREAHHLSGTREDELRFPQAPQ